MLPFALTTVQRWSGNQPEVSRIHVCNCTHVNPIMSATDLFDAPAGWGARGLRDPTAPRVLEPLKLIRDLPVNNRPDGIMPQNHIVVS
jgi:hypothetical protein